MIMKAAMGIFAVILILFMFSPMVSGIQSAKTDERTDAFSVDTGVGETTADVELVTDLYDDDILNVSSITSSEETDNPLPDSYVTSGNTLTVRGLAANTTRTLSVVYLYDSLTGDSSNAATFLGMMPWLVAIVIIMIILAAGFMAWNSRRG